MFSSSKPLIACSALLVLAACSRAGEVDSTGGVSVTRTVCPAVGVPAHTGDITLFNPPASRDAAAIDVTATLTNIRTTCNDQGAEVLSTSTFEVHGTRRNTAGAREVVLPYFATVVRAGDVVVSKRLGRVALTFADGEARASTSGQASANVNRAAATLPDEVRQQITRRRKPGDPDAAMDPMANPTVRAAVDRATFELLIGFQLTPEQLQYNATR